MLEFLKKGLSKTLNSMNSLKTGEKISKDLLETMLLEADVSYEIVEEILYYLPPSDEVKKEDLKRVMEAYFLYDNAQSANAKPFVELILGVNGAGKTTSIAKLANLYKKRGDKVILAACDTFRAGAIEQLRLWAEKIGVQIVMSEQGHDPSAVAFDTIGKAVANASLPLVLVAFIVAALVRISVGSSTVAMTMAAGIISAMPGISELSPLYLACVTAAIAGGSTVCSHFNDSGFWLVKSLVGMDEKTTLKTWTIMETLVGGVGFLVALVISFFA